MYTKLYRYRDKFVVIDDVDSLYADRNGVRLVKCLCQTEPEKTVAWHSAARPLEREGIPREFVTTSRVIIICNDWKSLNRNVMALQDRGHTLVFEPTAEEVHQKTGEWFDQEKVSIQWQARFKGCVGGHWVLLHLWVRVLAAPTCNDATTAPFFGRIRSPTWQVFRM